MVLHATHPARPALVVRLMAVIIFLAALAAARLAAATPNELRPAEPQRRVSLAVSEFGAVLLARFERPQIDKKKEYRGAPGDLCEVEWHGSWWAATVVAHENGRHYIHYDGYDNSWDEWVGPERIRGRRLKQFPSRE